ncbi:uncharacterized protein [Primulina huaijiensis]|uniref:uncharacterized protein isoform X2 n=1 Tax=Primulina huaijiensis TaxID=1492673 RepID=UPI003CC78952
MIRGTLCLFSKSFDPSAINEKKAHLCLSAGNSPFKIKLNAGSLYGSNAKTQGRKSVSTLRALPETAVSVTIAATIVVAAAIFLSPKTRTSDVAEAPTKTCEDCGGSGICSECNGEGFMLKKMSDESAEKARLLAKNMASRYTAGLPKKWSYCTKCSSGRSCSTCGGSGKLNS